MLQTYKYKGNEVTFNIEGETYINATEMAKPFNKKVIHFLKLKSTEAFLEALESEVTKTHFTNKGNYSDGTPQGTWMHELLAIEFAGWLAPEFKLWCNKRIRELLKTGRAHLSQKFQFDFEQQEILRYTTELGKRVEQLEKEVKKVKTLNLKSSINNRQSNWLSIKQYAMWNNISIPKGKAIQVAKRAKDLLAEEGLQARQIPDSRYGLIGAYPEHILNQAVPKILNHQS